MNARKRQKLSATKHEGPEESQEDSGCSQEALQPRYRGYALDTLPPEVLEMILRLLPFHEVATSVRLVSRWFPYPGCNRLCNRHRQKSCKVSPVSEKHCLTVAAAVLNAAFLATGARIEVLTSRVKQTLWRTKMNVEVLACMKALNILELIKAQYKLLRAVTWRYTHPPMGHQRFPRLCFYAGSLLDYLNDLLTQIFKCHASIEWSRDAYSCVADLVDVCKRFMNFFEKVSERRVNRSVLVSGCKIVDVLDCLVEGRQALSSKVTKKRSGNCVISMKLRYVMKRAWFTCLSVAKNSEENSWRDEQRFMYLRLRRLVGSVNDHLLDSWHYKSELNVQIPLPFPLKPPPASTYSGYGEYGGNFFYYGNMNRYAYESKFASNASSSNAALDTEQQVARPSTPSFDLVIDIELKCSPELAPLAARANLGSDELEAYETRRYKYQQLFLTMTVTCPASAANRLPGTFVWELRNPRYGRNNP